MGIINKLKEWYIGEYIPPPEKDPNSPVFIISAGHYEQSFIAKCLKVIGKFWLNHWQWILSFTVAIIALVFGYYRIK